MNWGKIIASMTMSGHEWERKALIFYITWRPLLKLIRCHVNLRIWEISSVTPILGGREKLHFARLNMNTSENKSASSLSMTPLSYEVRLRHGWLACRLICILGSIFILQGFYGSPSSTRPYD